VTGGKQGGGARKKPRRKPASKRKGGAQAAADPQRLLIFIHIPKTAGTTLTSLLRDNERTRIRAAGNVFKGGGGAREGAELAGLLGDGAEALKGVRFLTGHLPLGVGEMLPRKLHPGYFTVLRDPADRLLSHFFQIRARRGGVDEPNKLDLPPLPADATLKQALELGYVHDNLQTRMLCGDPEPFGDVTEEMLEEAKQYLDDLVFIGLTERFDESLVLAKRRLGLRTILYSSSGRVNQARPRGADIPAKLRRAAEAANRFDIELYEYGKQLFDSAPEREELDFDVELAALRAANAGDSAEPDGPVPAGFGGDEAAWGKLVSANVAIMQQERDLAAIRGLIYKLGERDPELVDRMRRMSSRRRRRHGREPDSAVEALQMLVRADARTRAGGRADRSERE
jgi:hypothetical protein